jgi:hypothetical protein
LNIRSVPYAAAIYRRKLVNFEYQMAKHRDSQNPPQQWRLNFEVGRSSFVSSNIKIEVAARSLLNRPDGWTPGGLISWGLPVPAT